MYITFKHSDASVNIFRLSRVNKRPGEPHQALILLFFIFSLSNLALETLTKELIIRTRGNDYD
jgi:hypothetical protein